MVVATHAIAYAGVGDSISTFLSFWVQSVAVPPFFLVDGFLFVRSVRNPQFSYMDYCARSARRLLVPWISFSILYIMLRGGFEFVGHPQVLVVLDHTLFDLLKAVYYSSISAQLYFLPALFLIRSMSFATKYLVSVKFSHVIIVWLAYVVVWRYFSISNVQLDGIDPVINALWGMQYYFLGMALAIYGEELIHKSSFLLAGLAGLALAMVKLFVPALVMVAQYAYLCALFFVFLGLSTKGYPFVNWGVHTMGIYLIHAPMIVKFVSYLSAAAIAQSSVMRYVTISIATFSISLIVVRFLSKFSWWRYLLGEWSDQASRGALRASPG